MSADEKQSKSPLVYDYDNYRLFLADLRKHLDQTEDFNLREFAKKAKIKSPGLLKMITDGKRNLSQETAKKFCQALNLKGKEKKFFLTLVEYNQSKDPDEKKSYFQKLIKLKPRSEEFLTDKKINKYYSKVYYACIREMVTLKDFKEDYKWIARKCEPQIQTAQAKEAIETLLDLGLLKRNDCGKLMQSENFVETRERNTQVAETYQYHEAVIDKARHALSTTPQEERHYYAMTIPITEDMFDEIVNDFYEFRDKMLEKIEGKMDGFDSVHQVNFQLFPVTKKKGESK